MKPMNFKLALFVLLLAATNSAMAQKNVDIDNLTCRVSYRELPLKPQDPLFFTYAAEVKMTKSTEAKVSGDEMLSHFNIAGQQRVELDQSPKWVVVFDLKNFIVKESKVNEHKHESKDKDGKVTTTYTYSVTVNYNFVNSFSIFAGGQVAVRGVDYAKDNSYTTGTYNTRKAASDYWNNNRDNLIGTLAQKEANNTAYSASSYLSRDYGFPVVGRDAQRLKITDTKKHPENAKFRAVCEEVKKIAEAMTPDVPMDKEAIQPAIDYFKEIPTRFTDPKLKADKKLRYAAYYNLCRIYLWLDQPEEVAPIADKLIANDHDAGDGKSLKQEADKLAQMLDRTKISVRHFDPKVYYTVPVE